MQFINELGFKHIPNHNVNYQYNLLTQLKFISINLLTTLNTRVYSLRPPLGGSLFGGTSFNKNAKK